jgi:hypothetical protein
MTEANAPKAERRQMSVTRDTLMDSSCLSNLPLRAPRDADRPRVVRWFGTMLIFGQPARIPPARAGVSGAGATRPERGDRAWAAQWGHAIKGELRSFVMPIRALWHGQCWPG